MRFLFPGLLLCAVPFLCFAMEKDDSELKITPGPTVISDEEKAIVVDRGRGIDKAVILLEETERNEMHGQDMKISFHIRIKILTNEGRSMGNVEIPFNIEEGDLQEWWGRTILPDGTVLELKTEDLKRQQVAGSGGHRHVHLKGVLPGIVPGSVIDYGYEYKGSGEWGWLRVPLDRLWALKEFRYRWLVPTSLTTEVRLLHADRLDVQTRHKGAEYLIIGHDFPPTAEEPDMPPAKETYGAAILYFLPQGYKDWWDMAGRRFEEEIRVFLAKSAPLKAVVRSLAVPPEADLHAKARAAYDWIAANMRNTSLQTSEEREAAPTIERTKPDTVADILQRGEEQPGSWTTSSQALSANWAGKRMSSGPSTGQRTPGIRASTR